METDIYNKGDLFIVDVAGKPTIYEVLGWYADALTGKKSILLHNYGSKNVSIKSMDEFVEFEKKKLEAHLRPVKEEVVLAGETYKGTMQEIFEKIKARFGADK